MSTPRKTKSKKRTRLYRQKVATLSPEDLARIGALEERLTKAEKRIEQLTKTAPSERLGPRPNAPISWPEDYQPRFPKPSEAPPNPLWPDIPWAGKVTCPSCHMDWEGVMGYCCPHTHCPMGAGPVTCGGELQRTLPPTMAINDATPQGHNIVG